MTSPLKSNADLLYAFCLGIVFAVLDLTIIVFTTEAVTDLIAMANPLITEIVLIMILSCIGTGIGCLISFILVPNKRLVPMGYSFFPVFVGICYLFVWLNVDADFKAVAYRLVSLYTLIPMAVGMAF